MKKRNRTQLEALANYAGVAISRTPHGWRVDGPDMFWERNTLSGVEDLLVCQLRAVEKRAEAKKKKAGKYLSFRCTDEVYRIVVGMAKKRKMSLSAAAGFIISEYEKSC